MPKVTITLEDLPAGDPAGNIRCTIGSEPPLTPEQKAGTVPLTLSQSAGDHLAGVIHRMLSGPAAPATDNNVIELAPATDGTLAEVVEVKEGEPVKATD
jgi:hypothetical protein